MIDWKIDWNNLNYFKPLNLICKLITIDFLNSKLNLAQFKFCLFVNNNKYNKKEEKEKRKVLLVINFLSDCIKTTLKKHPQ